MMHNFTKKYIFKSFCQTRIAHHASLWNKLFQEGSAAAALPFAFQIPPLALAAKINFNNEQTEKFSPTPANIFGTFV